MTDAEQIAFLEERNAYLTKLVDYYEYFSRMTRGKLTILVAVCLANVLITYLCFVYSQPFVALLAAAGIPCFGAMAVLINPRPKKVKP